MAKPRNTSSKPNPSQFLPLIPLLNPFSSHKNSQKPKKLLLPSTSITLLCFSLLSFFLFITLLLLSSAINLPPSSSLCSTCNNPLHSLSSSSSSSSSRILLASLFNDYNEDQENPRLSISEMVPLPAHGISSNSSVEENWFWKQPDDGGYKPCLDFGLGYRRESSVVASEKRSFLVVVASGGVNQQRNQIVDAVVIARILKAALVVPILKVNFIWGDESDFSDIFDAEHFKNTLKADVRIVSTLPFRHLISRQSVETQIPFDVSPLWIRTRFSKQLKEEGILVLKGLDSKLSKNLPSDLQKLRCKVAFHALRFAAPIRSLGNRLARRMWIEGPYIAIHLRLEKDVWVRTGCQTGLGAPYDAEISAERSTRPEYLTGRLNMSYPQRRLAGLCPLSSYEVARLLKGLGAPRDARVYVAGGKPYGGSEALKPLVQEFPNLVTKEYLAKEGELLPFVNRSSALAAIDYIVSLSSDVFLPSHGGNMGRGMQGHRAYTGHRKYIRPNKRMMIPLLEDQSLTETEFGAMIRKLHEKSQGQPESRTGKRDRDVIAYPVPECMCKRHSASS